MSKTDLCLQFIGMNESDDDLLHVVEELKDNKEQIKCVYPSKKACDRKATTNYGFCTRHSLTSKGKNIQKRWETALSEIETDLSEIEEEEVSGEEEVTEEEEVKEEEVKEEKEEESSNEKVDAKYVPSASDTSDEKSEESPKYNEDGVKLAAPGKYEFPIVKNKYGQNIHKASGLVFNLRSGYAIGKVAPEGKLYALDSDDVAFCKKYNVRHKVLY